METQTLVAIVGVGGALIGSAVGGFISFLSLRSVRRFEWELSLTQQSIQGRESLYAQFLSETSRLVIRQIDREFISSASDLTELFTLEAKVWLYSEPVGEAARKLVMCVIELRRASIAKEEPGDTVVNFADLKHKFISACRNDLRSLKDLA